MSNVARNIHVAQLPAKAGSATSGGLPPKGGPDVAPMPPCGEGDGAASTMRQILDCYADRDRQCFSRLREEAERSEVPHRLQIAFPGSSRQLPQRPTEALSRIPLRDEEGVGRASTGSVRNTSPVATLTSAAASGRRTVRLFPTFLISMIGLAAIMVTRAAASAITPSPVSPGGKRA